ncbi:hypothetical protein TrVGV298_004192 [Trichoderma virens]|nr:hypothetical protein TrVGV298_004192 [Trichoderma virens]
MSKDVSSAEDETSNPFSNKYPLSQQVFELEKRAQELQDNCEFWKKKSLELTLSLEGLTKLVKIERSDHEANRKSLEAANDALTKQLEQEKNKFKELQAKNESLSGEKAMLAKMLEEKTYESWIFRCAVAVVYKATPSARERVSMRQLIRDVFARLHENYQRGREAQEDAGAQDQNNKNNGNQVSEQAAESLPQQEESLLTAGAGKVDSDSEDMPLRDRKSLQKSQKRPRMTKGKGDRPSDDDSDEDQALFHVLKKKAKKLKIMPSRKESASSG